MLEPASLRRWVEELQRPEHTGENRCWPCTALNVAIALTVALAAARRSRPLGLLVATVGCALVSLRGYVVPGTPRFAPQLLAPLPFGVGHDTPEDVESGSLTADVDPEMLLASLAEADVVVADDETLRLDESFRDDWETRMATLRELSGTELAERTAAASSANVDGQFHDDRVLLAGERDVWLRPAGAIAETAAVETLAEWDVPEELRAPAARPLRTFVRTCPVCAGDVTETTLRACCGGPGGTQRRPERPVLACEACDTVVLEFEEPAR